MIALTKKFLNTSCRNCGSKIVVKEVCLDCNEPTITACHSCFQMEEYVHKGHEVLRL